MSDLRADLLAKILLMQNVVGQLPDARSIREFVARGVLDLPGVAAATFVDDSGVPNEGPDYARWPLLVNGRRLGTLTARISDQVAFRPYAPFVGNLCFMVTVVLERMSQRAQLEQHQRALEDEVERRTAALRQQIAERERAEARAVVEGARAQFLLEVSELVVVELDREGRVRAANERSHELLGYAPGELVGLDWFELIPEEERAHVHHVFRAAMAGQAELPHAFQNAVLMRTGERRTISWKNRAELGEDGRPVGTISAGEDVTARAEAERLLMTEKERLATTLRSLGEGVVTTDVAGAVLDMNEVAQKLTGYTLDEARGMRVDRIYRLRRERDQEEVPLAWQTALTTGSVVESPELVTLVSKDGVVRSVTDSLSPIRDASGHIHGLVLVFRDATERRRMFADMLRADRLEALGVMAGGIAHDFNNLLGGVFGYIDLAEEESSEPKVKESLSMAKSVFDRTKDLTQQLLTFAKGGNPIKKTIPIGPVVRENVQFALSGTKVACQFDLPEELWPCDVDRNQLGQVLDNLAINAVQAMPGGGRLGVTARNVRSPGRPGLLAPGEYVTVAISDTGGGIPLSILDRIFDPFFTTKRSGSGLGLATCHSIMQRHGGAIDVRSTPGAGTTFTLWLKASQRQVDAQGAATAVRHGGTGVIVVMDDEDYLLEVLTRGLERMGYEVAQARHGDAVLNLWAALRTRAPSVRAAFLDLTVRGGMGGRETAQALRAAGWSAPLFATSGYSEDPVMAHPASFGFSASLTKPFSLQALATFLDEWLPAAKTSPKVSSSDAALPRPR